jgi:hypothetical protein
MEEKQENRGVNKEFTEKQWKEGESGNPNGRPRGKRNFATLFREALVKLGERVGKTPDELELDIISKGVLSASKGDYKFFKDLFDRVYGQAPAKVEHSGSITSDEDNEAIKELAKKLDELEQANNRTDKSGNGIDTLPMGKEISDQNI